MDEENNIVFFIFCVGEQNDQGNLCECYGTIKYDPSAKRMVNLRSGWALCADASLSHR